MSKFNMDRSVLERDANQKDTPNAEPVPAASPLGTDDEAAETITIDDDRLARAREAEKKVGDAPDRHRQ